MESGAFTIWDCIRPKILKRPKHLAFTFVTKKYTFRCFSFGNTITFIYSG